MVVASDDAPKGWDAADALANGADAATVAVGLAGRIGPVPETTEAAQAGPTIGTMTGCDLPSGAPPPMLLDGWLHPEATTILYGKGGVGKGVTAAWHVLRLVREGHVVMILDYESHPREWGSRLRGLGATDDELRSIHYRAPYGAEWTDAKGPLVKVAHPGREDVARLSVTYLVVDSYSTATTTGDAMGCQEAAIELANAFARLGTPALLLAHVAGGGPRHPAKPFGSVHVHNLVTRRTWSVEADGEDEPDGPYAPHVLRLEYRNQKHNDGPRIPDRHLTVSFYPDDHIEIAEDAERKRSLADMAADVLGRLSHSATVKEVRAAIREDYSEDHAEDSISRALRRDRKRFTEDGSGVPRRWSLVP